MHQSTRRALWSFPVPVYLKPLGSRGQMRPPPILLPSPPLPYHSLPPLLIFTRSQWCPSRAGGGGGKRRGSLENERWCDKKMYSFPEKMIISKGRNREQECVRERKGGLRERVRDQKLWSALRNGQSTLQGSGGERGSAGLKWSIPMMHVTACNILC